MPADRSGFHGITARRLHKGAPRSPAEHQTRTCSLGGLSGPAIAGSGPTLSSPNGTSEGTQVIPAEQAKFEGRAITWRPQHAPTPLFGAHAAPSGPDKHPYPASMVCAKRMLLPFASRKCGSRAIDASTAVKTTTSATSTETPCLNLVHKPTQRELICAPMQQSRCPYIHNHGWISTSDFAFVF